MSFVTKPKEGQGNKSWMFVALLVFLFVTAGAVYYFMNKENKEQPLTENNILLTDTASKASVDTSLQLVSDSAKRAADSLAIAAKPSDGYSFKIVLKEYPSQAAANVAFQKLTTYGHKLLLTQKDSLVYKISMPFTSPLSDTLRAKDSLRRFFGGKPYVEL